jgi:Methyltransferase domain
MLLTDTFSARTAAYTNTTECNDTVYQDFSRQFENIPLLVEHRRHVETHQLGYGGPAFHYLWYLILTHCIHHFESPKFLEIGVFKGQIISLWSLIAQHHNWSIEISAISPLEGNPLPKSKWSRRWKSLINPRFAQEIKAGNFYPEEDYLATIQQLFQTFDLDFNKIRLIQGYSNDIAVLEATQADRFSVIYVDGDHTFNGVLSDLHNYASKLEPNGLLVMDDAAYYVPGTAFWKGHEPVSRACEIIPSLGFVNILNMGHNRVYQKVN